MTLFKVGDEVWYAGDITRQGACTIPNCRRTHCGYKTVQFIYAEAAALIDNTNGLGAFV
jgi:hypothetical protein